MYTPPYHTRAFGPGTLAPRRPRSRIRPSHVVWGVCFGLCAALLLFYGWHISSLDVGGFRSRSREDDYSSSSSSSSSSSGNNGGRGRRSRGLRSASTDGELRPGEELAPGTVGGDRDVGRYWEAPVMVSYAFMEKDMIQVCKSYYIGAGFCWCLSVRTAEACAWLGYAPPHRASGT